MIICPFKMAPPSDQTTGKTPLRSRKVPNCLSKKKIGPAGPRQLRHTTLNTFFEAFQRATGGSLRKNAGIIHGGGIGPAHIYLKKSSKDFAR